MVVVTRGNPEPPLKNAYPIKIFLAGGISGCHDWQSNVIMLLERDISEEPVLVYNPRMKEFRNSRTEAERQIRWEYERLEAMDIFTMYFAASETSVGPICLYELGRYICRMQARFPADWQRRIVIDVEAGYSRELDVLEHVFWATGGQVCVNTRANENSHAEKIKWAVHWLTETNEN